MRYIGTRGGLERGYSAAEAIREGMVPGGGLFVPESFPRLSLKDIEELKELRYEEISLRILKKYLSDYSEDEIRECVEGAYNDGSFSHEDRTPVVRLEGDLYVMELWHGPTAAFKDMALQLMPRLFVKAREKTGAVEKNLILVATSGDTGKAALEGFKDLSGIEVAVFYPEDGVSQVQKLQMTTTQGENLSVAAVKGNFDDCQGGVKGIFSDDEFKDSLKGVELSSANSINLGRLLPQIIYYFKAYAQLLRDGEIELGERVDFSVPTGNFGNILAGYYAMEMGLPVGKLICASNKNNVLTDFFKDGVYDRRREFHKTMSPSMDILVSSNLERFLYHILKDSERVGQIYDRFAREGIFSVKEEVVERIREVMDSGYTGEEECLKIIEEVKRRYNYSIDTHTAVAMKVAMERRERKVVVLSTASIYKFPSSVVKGLGGEAGDEFQEIETLRRITGLELHRAVEGIEKLPVVHGECIDREGMREYIEKLAKK
ncbi:threonine synthase [Propionigenium maris DSM 9537]|uniref:Threonine synthase n=1 Tax=Propionigenium maris DSM 9537 TaxID=1123000 RepID=A0A9W6LMG1_9FUSO|nr:threonine synthase [Propionigenium maris]GLI56296.1 threonine synthase [Propionigenium maris DSM 9537]